MQNENGQQPKKVKMFQMMNQEQQQQVNKCADMISDLNSWLLELMPEHGGNRITVKEVKLYAEKIKPIVVELQKLPEFDEFTVLIAFTNNLYGRFIRDNVVDVKKTILNGN